MKALSKQQIEWILKRVEEFAVYWSEHIPELDSEWQELMKQAKELHAKTRNDAYAKGLIIETINYIDSIASTNRPTLEMIGDT